MSEISTISEFLLHAGTEYRVFDMGRTIRQLDAQTFLHMEHGQTPVPRPRQGHVWLGIVFFNRSASTHHFIWFVKLPIDEQSCIISAGRQHFLQIIIEALGDTFDPATDTQAQLPDNPYTFIPSQALLADFNSVSRDALGLPPSQYYVQAKQYLMSPSVIDWRSLAQQGISDLAVRLEEDHLVERLIKAIPSLPTPFLSALFSSLEHHTSNEKLSDALIGVVREHDDRQLALTALRGLSHSSSNNPLCSLISELLRDPGAINQDLLTVITGRHWHRFTNTSLLNQFLESCAAFENGKWFVPLYRDLVQIPGIRNEMLKAVRNPQRSEAMSLAIGQLFSGVSS